MMNFAKFEGINNKKMQSTKIINKNLSQNSIKINFKISNKNIENVMKWEQKIDVIADWNSQNFIQIPDFMRNTFEAWQKLLQISNNYLINTQNLKNDWNSLSRYQISSVKKEWFESSSTNKFRKISSDSHSRHSYI